MHSIKRGEKKKIQEPKEANMGESYSNKDSLLKTSSQQSEDGACLSAMLLNTNMVYPSVLNAAIELNLFEIIAKANPPGAFMSASEIASKLPTQHSDLPNRLERMLRLLASYSILTCSTRASEHGGTERVYGLTHVSKYLVPDESRGYLASLTTFIRYPALLPIW